MSNLNFFVNGDGFVWSLDAPCQGTHTVTVPTGTVAAAAAKIASELFVLLADGRTVVNVTRSTTVATLPDQATCLVALLNRLYACCGSRIYSVDPIGGSAWVDEWCHFSTPIVFASPLISSLLVITHEVSTTVHILNAYGDVTSTCHQPPFDWNRSIAVAHDVVTPHDVVTLMSNGEHQRFTDAGGMVPFTDTKVIKALSGQPGQGRVEWFGFHGRFASISDDHGTLAVSVVTPEDLQAPLVVHHPLPSVAVVSGLIVFGGTEAEPLVDCTICSDELKSGEAVTLSCGHAFHIDCLQLLLARAEDYIAKGHRIVFNYAQCPNCTMPVRHRLFAGAAQVTQRRKLMLEDASERAPPEFPGVPLSTVIEAKYLYYVCHRCHLPFWGGNKDCGAFAAGEPDTEPSLLVCESCAASDFACPIHRRNFVVYRCQQCCNPATHLSLGHIRLCDRCVAAKSRDIVPCPGAARCPLHAEHAPVEGTSKPAELIGCLACMQPGKIVTEFIQPAPLQP